MEDVKHRIWQLQFSQYVFKKESQKKSTGVDISLTNDMLTHAFLGHYEVAVLVTGDQDYIPVIEQVKRFGKLVRLCFFADHVPLKLKLSCDWFYDITSDFISLWKWASGS